MLALAFISLFLNTSCDHQTVYDEQVIIEESQWSKEEAAHFEWVIEDTLTRYDLYINFRNTSDYRYSNLFMFLIIRFPDGKISRDTIECQVADRTGRWLGKGWGDLKENELLLSSGLEFPFSGKYEFLIIQAMREDILDGIRNVGLRLERSK